VTPPAREAPRNSKLTLGVLFTSALIALALAVVAIRASERQLEANRWFAHTHEVLASIARIGSSLTEVESGQRGFVVAGTDAYLAEYTSGVAHLGAELRRARALTADNPGQQVRLDRLENALARFLAAADQIVEARRTRGFDTAQRLMDSTGRMEQMGLMQGVLRELEQEEDGLLQARERTMRSDIREFWWSMIALIGALAITLPVFYVLIRRRQAQAKALHVELQQRLTGIIDSAMDAVITIDDEQRIVLFNGAAEALFGWPRAEALGASIALLIPNRFRGGHALHVERFGRTGVTARRMGTQRIVMGARRNGEEFPIEASISQVEQGGKRFYTVILRDVTDRVLAEDRLRESQEELHEIASSAQAAREQEKSRISRELHDELGQLLTALKMDLSSLRATLVEEAQLARVEAMEGLLATTVTATRRISSDLRPLVLDDLGLVPAAEWLVQHFKQRTGTVCRLTVEPPDLDLQDPQATAVYRILQESLTNVAKHAQARSVEVNIRRDNDGIRLTIHDDGRGFRPRDPRKPLSFGLVGLRERVYFLEGSVEIESEPGEGTTIRARIPSSARAGSRSVQ